MNTPTRSHANTRGVTLLEMSVVILVLLTLLSVGFWAARNMDNWKLGRKASETLREVYSAQRLFLADHPTTPVSSITNANILPYLPGSPTSMPTVESLDGTELTIRVDVSPPSSTPDPESLTTRPAIPVIHYGMLENKRPRHPSHGSRLGLHG